MPPEAGCNQPNVRRRGGLARVTPMFFSSKKLSVVSAQDALPGRADPLPDVPDVHFMNGNRIQPPFPDGTQTLIVGMGG